MPSAAPAFAFDAFDAFPDPTALLAPDGALLRANPAFRAVFRHPIGPQRSPWGRVHPPPFQEGLRRFSAPSPDGRLFEWIERELPDGRRLATARDITTHARAAEESLRAKTTLFATLTHELRTPLNGVLGMAGLLAETTLEPAQQSYVAAIRQSGELLLDLITEILDYSRLETGRMEFESAPFDPEATMQDVAELLSPKAHDRGLEIAVVTRAATPARVIGDDGRLRQILFNLAGNAVKFTESGGVVLELAPLAGDRLRFTVRDTGVGIAPDKQGLVFEEFAQADAGVARRYGGAGLGLAIVKKLVHAMGGEVGVQSRLGQGSSFWVDLPFPRVEGGARPASLVGVRACVVSDSELLRTTASATLASLGASVVTREEKPQIIVFDARGEPESEQIAALKRDGATVIALMPQEQRGAVDAWRAAGVEHYTLKPIRRRSLAERVRVALGAPKTPDVPRRPTADTPQKLRGLRVLLAEDNPINALLARTLLTREGCIVDVVQDGEEAVAAARAAPYDLILLDIRMPRLDGIAAAQRIRVLPGPIAQAPIVALTADAGEDERSSALKAGMDDFITKPIDAARLLAVAARFTNVAKAAND